MDICIASQSEAGYGSSNKSFDDLIAVVCVYLRPSAVNYKNLAILQIESYGFNMQGYIPRDLHNTIQEHLAAFPAVAMLGPRQSGKTTLALEIVKQHPGALYLDLEKPSDLRKLQDAELFFESHSEALICLDEIQRLPDIFTVLRSVIDQQNRKGQFLILGSASRDLIRQSAESLAGRISYLELTPFLQQEILTPADDKKALLSFWQRGGFPPSHLAASDLLSMQWRENFIRTFLERDIPQIGFAIPAASLRRLWTMLAHVHGQLLNASKLGASLGVSHTTIRTYLDLLSQTFMVRVLQPYAANVKKRLIKSPKIYIRDSGILHALLEIDTFDDLLGHPAYGASWEGLVLENIIASFPNLKPWFYRTSSGAEIDLILTRGQKRIAIECKASSAPQLTRGFWNALDDLQIERTLVVAPVTDAYPIKKNVEIVHLAKAFERLTQWLE